MQKTKTTIKKIINIKILVVENTKTKPKSSSSYEYYLNNNNKNNNKQNTHIIKTYITHKWIDDDDNIKLYSQGK